MNLRCKYLVWKYNRVESRRIKENIKSTIKTYQKHLIEHIAKGQKIEIKTYPGWPKDYTALILALDKLGLGYETTKCSDGVLITTVHYE